MTDMVLSNGRIHTVDGKNSVVEAMLVRHGRVSAVGTTERIRSDAGPGVRVVDLNGQVVVPGFIDPHNHLTLSAFEPISVDCYTPPLQTLDEVLDRIATQCRSAVPGQWVRGVGFFPPAVAEGRPPTRRELDAASPHNPFFLLDASCNAAYVNSSALALAGIDRNTPQPWGGEIAKDEDGTPSGVLFQAALNPLQTASWKSYASRDWDVAVELLNRRMQDYLAVGITGICDAAVTPDSAELYRRADDAGMLPFTVQQIHTSDDFFARQDLGRTDFVERVRGGETDRLRGGAMKIFVDQAFPEGPAMEREVDGCRNHSGRRYYSTPEVVELALGANNLGIDTAIHAMGNGAVESVLEAYQAVRRQDTAGRLLRIEHAFIAATGQAARLADAGIDLVAKPGLVHELGQFFSQAWRGDSDEDLRVLPVKSMIDAGVRVSFGSDTPAGPFAPAQIMWGAVSRRSMDGSLVDVEEMVSGVQALRCSTIEAAAAASRQAEEGSLEVGKRANFVVVDRDVTTCAADDVRGMTVLKTFVDGRLAHEAAQ